MRTLPVVLLALACRTPAKSADTADLSGTTDADGDGYTADEDCDDADAAVNPGAEEVCNGVDDDCDDETDEGVLLAFHADADGDGFGDPAAASEACEAPEGTVRDDTDCDDTDPDVFPDAPERCDGVDQDCDGEIDEDVQDVWFADADGDGFGDADSLLDACDPPDGYVAVDRSSEPSSSSTSVSQSSSMPLQISAAPGFTSPSESSQSVESATVPVGAAQETAATTGSP